jgi:glycosyltransferase involved in cell wall biosynthesis
MKHWFGSAGGIGVLLTDPWVISAKIAARLPLLAWVPLDHNPMIPRTRKWFQESGALPVAMSRFGERQLRESGFESVYYVPHGFNPAVFRPVDRGEARRLFGIPEDAFVVGIVAANLGTRKAFEEAIDAFGQFRKTHTDAVLYLHTKIEDPKGVHLPTLCRANGVKPIVADQYGLELGTPEGMVAILYSAFDVLLNPARGEGFGLTTLEAQACGTPCIVTNAAASPEVAPAAVGNWNVDGQRTWTGFESYQVTPSVEEIVAALEEAYAEGEADRQTRRVSVFHHANQHYQHEGITEQYWKPVLRDATIEIQLRDQLVDRH